MSTDVNSLLDYFTNDFCTRSLSSLLSNEGQRQEWRESFLYSNKECAWRQLTGSLSRPIGKRRLDMHLVLVPLSTALPCRPPFWIPLLLFIPVLAFLLFTT